MRRGKRAVCLNRHTAATTHCLAQRHLLRHHLITACSIHIQSSDFPKSSFPTHSLDPLSSHPRHSRTNPTIRNQTHSHLIQLLTLASCCPRSPKSQLSEITQRLSHNYDLELLLKLTRHRATC